MLAGSTHDGLPARFSPVVPEPGDLGGVVIDARMADEMQKAVLAVEPNRRLSMVSRLIAIDKICAWLAELQSDPAISRRGKTRWLLHLAPVPWQPKA